MIDISSLLRQMTRLVKQIGENGFLALVNPYNTAKVMEFVKTLVSAITMLIGDRTYEVLPHLHDDDDNCISNEITISRATEIDVNLGEDDCQYILAHQKEIPVEFRGKVVFAFPAWKHPDASSESGIAYIGWINGKWILILDWMLRDRAGCVHFIRRVI